MNPVPKGRIIGHHIYLFIGALIEISSGIVKIATLTLYLPTWDLRFLCWYSGREAELEIYI